MKRILMAILCLLLLAVPANAAVSVRMEEGALLLREDGSEIVAVGQYNDIVSLGEDLFAARTEEKWALMAADGSCRTSALYDDMRLRGGMLLAQRGGRWGMLNADGEEISLFEYTMIVTDEQGGAWAIKGDRGDLESDMLFLLDAEGSETETGIAVRRLGDTASEGLVPVQAPESGLWGYCDRNGNIAIPEAYSYAGVFAGGVAPVVYGGAYGAIDASGGIVAEAKYDYLEISDAGLILAAENGMAAWVLDLDGNDLACYEGEENFVFPVGEGYVVYDGRRLCLYSSKGDLLETISREGSVYAGLNGQWILSDGSWGEACVRIRGTDRFYQNLFPLGVADEQEIYACMQVNTARYANDLLGEIQLAVDMETARYGIVNGSGEEMIPCIYESIEYLGNGRLLLQRSGLWEMTDAYGRVYWSCGAIQSEASSF